jgi:hypothetical protein
MIALVVLCFVVGSVEARADVRLDTKTKGMEQIVIDGVIQPNDATRLTALFPSVSPLSLISLNSTGGDVTAAMALGRILRREQRKVIMGPHDQCVSACVLVMAGAVERWVYGGNVGIHRPFLTREATTLEQQKGQYANIEKVVKSYLAEMNVEPRLYDDMLRISPLAVRYLTEEELTAYGLIGTDPYYEQATLAHRAQQLGISMAELLRRKNAGLACGDEQQWLCQHAIEVGIPLDEYSQRDATAREVCASLPPWKWQACYDHAIIRRSEKK